MRRLVALSYSPWSEKARWALDHHRVEYRRVEYVPMLGAPLLRAATRRWSGRVTVPVLLGDGPPRLDSWDIALRAEEIGEGAPLFAGDRGAIAGWNALSDRALAASRAAAIARVAADPGAQQESLPGLVPSALRPALRPVATVGVGYFRRKYGGDAPPERALEDALAELREALDARGGEHVLGELSYADIAMAAALQFVRPVADRFIRLGPASRRAYSDEALARRYEDLIEWRDRFYDRYR